MKKIGLLGFGMAAVVMLLSGCASKDVYDEKMVEQNQRAAYAANFEKRYGQIAPNQTWDFTSGVKLGTRAGEDILIEIVDGLDFGFVESVDENKKVVNTVTKNLGVYNDVPLKLPDQKKHKGESAILVAPSNDFYIYPISCQGAWRHELWVRVGDAEPVMVYKKSWGNASMPFLNGMALSSKVNEDGTVTVSQRAQMNGVHISAPTGTPVEVYLDKVNNGSAPMASTVTGSAIVINAEARPEGIPINDNSVVQYIGIEDQYDYDFDYNDLTLVVVGNPDTPPTEKIVDDKYTVPTSIAKRYMIEDLGATDDFDFNDIVVDVVENTVETHHRTYKTDADGNKTELLTDIITKTTKTQKATIVHLGGTLPFTLKVGNTSFGEMEGQLDVDVNISKTVSGWSPEKNNVSIVVQEKDGSYYEIAFPRAGEAPMIIAFDPEKKWMRERQCVPREWFYIPE